MKRKLALILTMALTTATLAGCAAAVPAPAAVSEYGCTVTEPDESIREATIPAIKPMVEDWDLIQSYAK